MNSITRDDLTFASRVDRLAELALERLMCAPDEGAIEGAVAELLEIRDLVAKRAAVSATDTIPAPPLFAGTDAPPIPKGKAKITVAGAIVDVLNTIARLEGVAMAAARALDETG